MSDLPSAKEPAFWQQSLTALLEYSKTTPNGLTSSEAAKRLLRYGPNQFHPQRRNALLLQFLAKFSNPLVIFIIRTRKNPLKSHPNPWLTVCSLLVVALAILIPFTPLGSYLGFVPPPPLFFFILAGMVIVYLLIVEAVKQWFYKRYTLD